MENSNSPNILPDGTENVVTSPTNETAKTEELPKMTKPKGFIDKIKAKAEADPKQFVLKFILPIAIVIILIVAVSIGITTSTNYKLNKTAKMLQDVGETEMEHLLLVLAVWNNCEERIDDSATNKYTKVNGFFVDPPETAVGNLVSSEEYKDVIEDLEDDMFVIYRRLKNMEYRIDYKYDPIYDLLVSIYDAYDTMLDDLQNPLQYSHSTLTSRIEELREIINIDVQQYITKFSNSYV